MVLAQACYLPLSLFLHLKICLFNMSGKFCRHFHYWQFGTFTVIKAPTYRVRSNGQSRSSKLHTFTFRTGHYYCLYVQCFCIYPHSLFWMDYLSGTLHFPLQQRNLFWVLYGVGSCVGAFVAYCLSRLIGYLQAIKCLYGVYCLAVALPFFHMLLLCSLYRPFLQVYSHLPPYLLALTACYRFMNSVIKNLEPCHHWVCQHSVIRWRCY